MNICTVMDCSNKYCAKGLCEFHYLRKKKGISFDLPKYYHKRIRKYSDHLTYVSWASMKQRCLNKNHIYYANYGGRGVTIYEPWLNFDNFLKDVGKRENKSLTLDRIDNNGNYEPGNVRWVTRSQQAINTRRNKHAGTDKYNRVKKYIDAGIDQDRINYAMGL